LVVSGELEAFRLPLEAHLDSPFSWLHWFVVRLFLK
jgi:hypothetical protein